MNRATVTRVHDDASWRLWEHLTQVRQSHEAAGRPLSGRDTYTVEVLTEYVRYARRQRWSFKLIGEALGISAERARRLFREWQDRTYPE